MLTTTGGKADIHEGGQEFCKALELDGMELNGLLLSSLRFPDKYVSHEASLPLQISVTEKEAHLRYIHPQKMHNILPYPADSK